MNEPQSHAPTVLGTRGEGVRPDVTTYLLHYPDELFVIDPGPGIHLQNHLNALNLPSAVRITVILLTPGLTGTESLAALEPLASSRRLVGDLPALSGMGDTEQWETLIATEVRTPLGTGTDAPLVLLRLPAIEPAGSLLCYDPQSQTLFTGPLFGSIGTGISTDKPVLRRESVKAYTDLYTPGSQIQSSVAELQDLDLATIAPTRGRPAFGGVRLIERLFATEPADRNQPPLLGLYRRIAALAGTATADSLLKSAGVQPPDLGSGFSEDIPDGAMVRLKEHIDRWLNPDLRRAIAAYEENREEPDKNEVHRSNPEAGREGPDGEHDELTGLLNERALRERIRTDSDAGLPFVVLLISLDGIESINRRFGRTGGDDALYAASYLMSNFGRLQPEPDRHRLYKLSGPQFCALVERITIEQAEDIAESIRETVANSAMFLEQITVSIGAVGSDEATPGNRDTYPVDPAARLLAHATMRLRLAQGRGMNTVCSTDPEVTGNLSSGHSVLLADPDAPYLSILSRQLDEQGFSVLTAGDGMAALEIIEQIVPDAIVCEAMLPKRNGFALRDELRRSSRLSEIPFVMVSHRKNDEELEKAAARGVVHFLQKPFSLIELTGLLRNLTEGAGT